MNAEERKPGIPPAAKNNARKENGMIKMVVFHSGNPG
jgi:hypothetical protein